MTDDRWIIIPRWDEFQHRDMARSSIPPWIKIYTELNSKDDFLNLSFHLRGILLGIWVEYARSKRQLRGSTLSLTRRLGHRVSTRDFESLNHAGFITLSASRPASTLASEPASLEVEVDKRRASIHSKEQTPTNIRRAQAWIRNGLAHHVPDDQLATVIQDEFNIDNPAALKELVAQARNGNQPHGDIP